MNDIETPTSNPSSQLDNLVLGDDCPTDSNKPLTVIVEHFPRRDKLDVFEKWCKEIAGKSSHFPGYMDTEIIQPFCSNDDDPDYKEYIAIFRFDTYAHLKVWMESPERLGMIDRVPEFASTRTSKRSSKGDPEQPMIISYHSLEYWFSPSSPDIHKSAVAGDDNGATPPEHKGGGPPSTWKMVIVTTLIIWGQLQFIPRLMIWLAPNMNGIAMEFLVTFMIVVCSSYVWFPIITRLLAFWLFPQANYVDMLKELIPRLPSRLSRSNSINMQQTEAEEESPR